MSDFTGFKRREKYCDRNDMSRKIRYPLQNVAWKRSRSVQSWAKSGFLQPDIGS